MIQTDFYTGEPVQTGSPPVSATDEAAAMASFGKYDYEPGARQQTYYPAQLMPPGGYSYGYTYGGGIGAPPPYYGYSQYGNPNPTYGQYMGQSANPVFNNPQYAQQQAYNPPKTFTIEGIRPFGEYMPPLDWQEQVDQLEMQYCNDRINQEAKQEVDRIANPFGYNYGYGFYNGYNYYGTPYYNPYQYNSINAEYQRKLDEIKEKARENSMAFTMQIARLAHNFIGYNISDDALRERFTGKVVEIPEAFRPPQNYEEYVRQTAKEVPFDNSHIYREYFSRLKKEYDEIIPPDSNLKDTFAKMGIIQAKWELEEEQHRRKNASSTYNSSDNSYKYYVREKAKERYAKEKGVILPGTVANGPGNNNTVGVMSRFVESSPILSQVANLQDDGTLNVSISLPQNVGSNAGNKYTVHNSQEAEYDEKRQRFGEFLGSIKGSITLDQQKNQKLENYNYG